jgi:hypothetical protein
MDIPAYTPFTERARHKAIESALDLSAETLQIPDVRRRLGQYAVTLMKVIERATIPNIRNNEVVLEGCRTDSVPIVAVHIGEQILRQSKDLIFNPSQKYAINKQYKSGIARDIFKYQEQFYRQGPTALPVPVITSDAILARVHIDYIENDNGSWPMHLYSRPLVQFNLNASHTISPVVALHEFTHVTQIDSKPVNPAKKSPLPAELEAFYVAAEVVKGYRDAGRQDELEQHTSPDTQETALDVESIREYHNGLITDQQPFAYSRELFEDLAMNNLGITPGVAALVDLQTKTTV